jgi:hypothetical protein
MTKTTKITKAMETENTPIIPGMEVTKGNLPEVSRKGFSKRSKYDFLADLTPDELATFTVENDKKAATLRTTLFGWSKRHEGIKIKTAYDREAKKIFIKVLREDIDKGK